MNFLMAAGGGGGLKAETESETTTTQDQAFQTKYEATKLLRAVTDRKCRLCPQNDEKIDITSACTILAK